MSDWIVRFFGRQSEQVEVQAKSDQEAGSKALATMSRRGNPKLWEEIEEIIRKPDARSGDQYDI